METILVCLQFTCQLWVLLYRKIDNTVLWEISQRLENAEAAKIASNSIQETTLRDVYCEQDIFWLNLE